MRTLRFLGMTLLMVMLAVNFTACSDDEEEQTIIDQANLIGKWQSTWEKIHKVTVLAQKAMRTVDIQKQVAGL